MKIIASRYLYFSFFLSILLILSSCAKTRTITPITQSNRSKIKKIAILVEADDEFSISVSKEKRRFYSLILELGCRSGASGGSGYAAAGAAVFCGFAAVATLIGAAIEEPIRSHIDEKHEEVLEAKLTHFHPGELMTEKLKNYLELSNAGFTAEIPEVNSPSILKAKGFDSVLEVNLKEWGLTLCPIASSPDLDPEEREILTQWGKYALKVSSGQFLYSEDALNFKQEELEEIERLKPVVKRIYKRIYSDKVNVWFKLSGRMILIDDNSTVWERVEFYKDDNCYPLEDLKTQPELLVDILSRAIHNLAENTVNEIL